MRKTVWAMALFSGVISCFLTPSHSAWAKDKEDYVVFDGRMYNGKFYPRVEVIEWTEQGQNSTHMEFQNYTKRMPIDLSFKMENTQGKNVMLVKYFLPERGEYLCRRVLAPGHFKEGTPFHFYKDQSDKDMDVVFVSQLPLPEKSGRTEFNPKPYTPCEEPKEESPRERLPAATEQDAGSETTPPEEKYKPGNNGGITKKGVDVPFGDL